MDKRRFYFLLVTITLFLLFLSFSGIKNYIPDFDAFSTIFLSVVIEAVPFLLVGTLFSSLINSFISPDFIRRTLPKNHFFSLLGASLFGLILPVCECAVIPVVRRLIAKGLPPFAAVSFLLAAPIVNPVVIVSTYYAFNGDMKFVLLRITGGLLIAWLTGLRVLTRYGKTADILTENNLSVHHQEHGHSTCGECCCSAESPDQKTPRSLLVRLQEIASHTCHEFIDVIGFFIFGAFISSLFNTYLPREVFGSSIGNLHLSVLIMMTLAYTLSICSESDAFIARTFSLSLPAGSVLAFMVFGPMLDIKNTLMLRHYFKPRFVSFLIVHIIIFNIMFALVADFLF